MDLASLGEQLRTAPGGWQSLPPRMRVLFITGYQRTGGWLAEALLTESHSDVLLEEAVGASEGMSRLRDEVFDVVLVSHEVDDLDALATTAAIRAGGADEPLVALGTRPEHELVAEFYEAGADAYVCVATATARTLIWTVARAVHRTLQARENRRLVEAERQRLAQEHQEAERLLSQQRALVGDLEKALSTTLDGAADAGEEPPAESSPSSATSRAGHARLPAPVIEHYRELLRAYVIMGSGNLTQEMGELAELLASAGISARQTMWMHLEVLRDLVRTLGSRSARHVIARADLLALEIMVHLAEGYRYRLRQQLHPPRQMLLPGLDATGGTAST